MQICQCLQTHIHSALSVSTQIYKFTLYSQCMHIHRYPHYRHQICSLDCHCLHRDIHTVDTYRYPLCLSNVRYPHCWCCISIVTDIHIVDAVSLQLQISGLQIQFMQYLHNYRCPHCRCSIIIVTDINTVAAVTPQLDIHTLGAVSPQLQITTLLNQNLHSYRYPHCRCRNSIATDIHIVNASMTVPTIDYQHQTDYTFCYCRLQPSRCGLPDANYVARR